MPENEDNIEVDNQGEPQEPKPSKYFNLRFDTDPDLSIYGFKELFFNLLPLNLTKLFAIVFLASVTISIGSGLCLYLAWAIEGGYQNSFSSVTDGIEALMAFNTDVFQIDDVVAYYSSSFLLASVGLSFLLLVISTMKFFKSASKPRIVVVILLILAVVGSVVAYSVIYLTDTPDFLISGTPVHSASLVEKTMIPFCVFLVASIAFVIVTYGEIMSEEYYKATWGSLILSLGIVGLVLVTLENIVQMIILLIILAIVIFIGWSVFGSLLEGLSGGGTADEAPAKSKKEKKKSYFDNEFYADYAKVHLDISSELLNAKIGVMDEGPCGERGIFYSNGVTWKYLCTVADFYSGNFKIYSKKSGVPVSSSDIRYIE